MKLIPVKHLKDGTCENKNISSRKQYLIKYEGRFYAGKFERQHYGWNFDGVYDAGVQLNYEGLTHIWEIKQR